MAEEKEFYDHKERSSTLYSRTSLELYTFEDFQLKSIIGKGTFGKV